ncbi:hypothetical protein ACI2KR_30155 [Pseudomonas luteola]
MSSEIKPSIGHLDDQADLSFKDRYETSLTSEIHNPASRNLAEKVLNRLLDIKPNKTSLDLTARIHEASAKGNVELILQLSDELKKRKEEEDAQLARLTGMKSEYTFDELLTAFPEELQALAYELAYEVLNGVEAALNGSKRKRRSGEDTAVAANRRPKTAKTYVISRNGKQILATTNTGRPSHPGNDREFFEFLGFSISEDGKTLNPPTFTDISGNSKAAISKKAIIEDMLAGNENWSVGGYKIQEQSVSSEE